MSKISHAIDINNYINRLSDKEFTKILDTQSGDRDYLIFNLNKNCIDVSKLKILLLHPAYEQIINSNINYDSFHTLNTTEQKLAHQAKFQVIKRDGRTQTLDFEKVYERMRKLWESSRNQQALKYINEDDLKEFCNLVIRGIYDKISTSELDEQAAVIAAHMVTKHYEYGTLASRIVVSNHSKNLRTYNFMGVVEKLYRNKDASGNPFPLVSKELYKFVGKNKSWIESHVDYNRDFNFDFFGFKTLERSYLLKIQRTIWERPQDMVMRVAIGMWIDVNNINEVSATSELATRIINTYNGMSLGYFTHASPTLFNSGTPHNQFLSCFLAELNDSLEGILGPFTDICQISKYAGGNGLHIHTIRSTNAEIKGTNGSSSGPIKFTQILGKGMEAFDQGGRRKGALALYMSPEHPQFIEFVELRVMTGDLASKTRVLFIGTWIPDLLWYRWLLDENWSMFDPNETMTGDSTTEEGKTYGAQRYLARMYGDEYEQRYHELEKAGRAKATMKAHDILVRIASAQMSTGMPYMCYKDEVNRCTNQRNVGVIHSSNLCSEIVEYSDEDEYACCTLASICLPKYVIDSYDKTELTALDAGEHVRELDHKYPKNPKFDFMALATYVRIAVRNLDRIIDINKYPVYQTKLSNLRHRPLGVGVQGLADVFHKMKLAWGSSGATKINKLIFETIYYAALTESCDIAHGLYKSYAQIAQREGKVKVPIDYQARPIVKKSTVVKYDGDSRAYNRNKFTTEWIVEPIYGEFVLKGMSNPNNLPILPKTAGAYTTFVGSPMSYGKFQFDLRNEEADMINSRNAMFFKNLTPEQKQKLEDGFGSLDDLKSIMYRNKTELSDLWEWDSLREKIKIYGVRNSQLVALMPTSSTSQIMGNNECIEPYTENMYKRTTLAGDFIVVNPYLIKELTDLGLWNESVENNIKVNDGSVQFLDEASFNPSQELVEPDVKSVTSDKPPLTPEMWNKINDIKLRYRTSYEIPQKVLIDLAADRQAFVDQSQSLNLHMRDSMDLRSIIGMHFYGWAKGLKTGMYYLRIRSATRAQKFTISVKDVEKMKAQPNTNTNESFTDQSNVCLSCSS
jgi:ribonucleoside-diphosphate reductase alpha subunit